MTTSWSVPLADARVAVQELADEHRWQSMYARFLNRLLFRLVTPRQRHRLFRRFYRVLSDDAIERFYSHRFTAGDAAKIIVGLPPTVIGLRPIRFVRSFFRRDN
ncbi:lycopene cyclase family protein [Stieleria sp. ICT_E10.1]|uniref:lycopene cyclase family protein n=1 Tax=Stieleria sedimenti TaxID=2976331 RepID=UPI00217FE7D9|nr:lycopene cyclase family protein [Stieleria sedimenti]MCS7468054.1 lycopene cyclase family protein [Stieleria sedimenti]